MIARENFFAGSVTSRPITHLMAPLETLVMETVKGLGTIQLALFSIISDVATIFWQFAAAILAFSFAITKVYMTEISFIPTRFNGTDS